jgi:hypothetical protein
MEVKLDLDDEGIVHPHDVIEVDRSPRSRLAHQVTFRFKGGSGSVTRTLTIKALQDLSQVAVNLVTHPKVPDLDNPRGDDLNKPYTKGWTRDEWTVRHHDGTPTVEGYIAGTWGLYRNDLGGWKIIHLPTGLSLGESEVLPDGKKVAGQVDDHFWHDTWVRDVQSLDEWLRGHSLLRDRLILQPQ